jgi:hypothetical protein
MLLVSLIGFLSILLTNLLIEIRCVNKVNILVNKLTKFFCRDYHTMDTLAALVIMIATCATMFPLSVYSAKVLLQVLYFLIL